MKKILITAVLAAASALPATAALLEARVDNMRLSWRDLADNDPWRPIETWGEVQVYNVPDERWYPPGTNLNGESFYWRHETPHPSPPLLGNGVATIGTHSAYSSQIPIAPMTEITLAADFSGTAEGYDPAQWRAAATGGLEMFLNYKPSGNSYPGHPDGLGGWEAGGQDRFMEYLPFEVRAGTASKTLSLTYTNDSTAYQWLSVGLNAGGFAYPVSPVPEPETYALMLAGLAVLGFSRRKSGKS